MQISQTNKYIKESKETGIRGGEVGWLNRENICIPSSKNKQTRKNHRRSAIWPVPVPQSNVARNRYACNIETHPPVGAENGGGGDDGVGFGGRGRRGLEGACVRMLGIVCIM